MGDSLHSTPPVTTVGGFAGRTPNRQDARHAPGHPAAPAPRAGDRVDVESAATVARRIVRERVLARTRLRLELDTGEHGPAFAEAIDTEPVDAFVGRLLSAQNQLAARRVATLGAERVRRLLDQSLRQGATEALELLSDDGGRSDGAAVIVIAEVLAEYGRRLAAAAPDAPLP